MALPLPKVVEDVGPGGPLVTSMGGINALNNNIQLRRINKAKADLAPWTESANAMSKLAYANLMGPQFMAKLMGNDAFVANLSEKDKKAMKELVQRAGMGQGSANSMLNLPGGNPTFNGIGQPSTNSFSGWLKNAIQGIVGQKPQQGTNPLTNVMPQMQAPQQQQAFQQPQMHPQMQPQAQPQQGEPRVGDVIQEEDNDPEFTRAYKDWQFSPEGQRELAKGEAANIPDREQVIARYNAKNGTPPMEIELTEGQREPKQKTYAENAGEYKGIIKEGEELGKIRATSKKELDQDYQQALQLKQPFDRLTKIITNPKFQNLRNLPGFQKLQMKGKATFGTPEEKKLIGEFQAAARQVVSATVKGFGGRILASEIPLSESMKLNDNDSIEAMLGKAPVIEAFNEMTLQRSRLASKLMKDQHLDKGDALEQADKMVDGEAIRKKVEDEIEPNITIENPETGEKLTLTKVEARRRGFNG